MTEETLKQFYNDEYRRIYAGFPHQERWNDDEYLFNQDAEKAVDLKAFLASFDFRPKSVLDFGSNLGATLAPFKEEGAIVYGVEICESSRHYAQNRGIPTLANLDDVIATGFKADLIILQDMIEHLTNFSELSKLKELLADNGRVFIYTPGLFSCNPQRLFQNAHNYQFIGATLEAVMVRLGFIPEFIDERIVSLWRRAEEDKLYYVNTEAWFPTEWRKYVIEQLEQKEVRTVPPVRTRCKFSEQEMFKNLEANLALKLPSLLELKDSCSGDVIIIGGGPSVNKQTEKIEELKSKGYPLVVIERMYPWAVKRGLKPDYVVALDASDDVDEGFTNLCPDTTHLLAATIHPKVFDCLNGHKKYIWSGASGAHPNSIEMWRQHGYDKVVIVNTGGSVVLGSMFLSLYLGFRKLHVFGFDCMVPKDSEAYASGIAGKGVDRTYYQLDVGDETIFTCTSFIAFVQQFFKMMETARQWGMLQSVDVYGESLITKMWENSDEFNRITSASKEKENGE